MAFCREKQGKPYLTFFLNDEKERTHVHFLLNGQKKVNRKHALRQSRREKPSALLYRLIIKPQHLWLECYFFFVSSNKEKVTKKACPEQGRGENAALCGFLLYSFLLHSKLVFFRLYPKTLLLTLMPFSCRCP